MSQITAHVLDTTKGRPASSIQAILFRQEQDRWIEVAQGLTDSNGRISNLLAPETLLNKGTYKLQFITKDYFSKSSTPAFYPYIDIVFEVTSGEHYHIPLLLSPFGFTTYRGS